MGQHRRDGKPPCLQLCTYRQTFHAHAMTFVMNIKKHVQKLVVIGRKINGAAYVTRTRDPVITNDVLYQLS